MAKLSNVRIAVKCMYEYLTTLLTPELNPFFAKEWFLTTKLKLRTPLKRGFV